MAMSLFDDDFYSTRVSRRSRGRFKSGFRTSGGFIQNPLFRVAIISSLTSSLFVAILFAAFSGGSEGKQEAKPALTAGQSLVETSERIISASEKVKPAVVSIINLTNQALEMMDNDDLDSEEILPEYANLGSGVIFRKEKGKAYIITNAHVVHDASKVEAVLQNGEKKKAKIVGTDFITDLAVLEVDDKGIDNVVEIGSSEKLRDGEMVIASGNPLGYGDSLTQGIVSNRKRLIPVSLNQDGVYDWEQEVIQIDAAINQGNSGGALVDLNGKLVGINSMKVADYGVEGIGFAIPIDDAMPILELLLASGKVSRPYLGVYSMDLDLYLDGMKAQANEDAEAGEEDGADNEAALPVIPEGIKNGIIVLEAVGPAKQAGLKFNDVIVALDGKAIRSTLELRKYLYNAKKIGDTLEVAYYRDGKKLTLTVKLEEKTNEEQ